MNYTEFLESKTRNIVESGFEIQDVNLNNMLFDFQKYASPVWMDVDYSRTLQYRNARDNNDEKHITPLQLDTIDRILHLYSNEGEVVFSPFAGIGSEGYQSIENKRKTILIELKDSYFNAGVKNLKSIVEEKNTVLTLF